MGKVKHFFTSLLGASSSEFSGFVWLVATATICAIALFIVDRATQQPYSNYENDSKLLDSLLQVMNKTEAKQTVTKTTISYFEFDPNTASKEQLLQLGFPGWLARQLINYRSKGGNFRKSEDLLKLYNFPDTLYEQVAPYVRISQQKKKGREVIERDAKSVPKVVVENKPKTLPAFDINTADTAVLQTIKGIGSVLSNRIITYRDKLGGFIDPIQLYEVYHLDSTTINTLLGKAYITEGYTPARVSINVMGEKELAAHPYITWKQAKLIVAYRNQHGDFTNRESLLNVYSINEEWLQKIEPYLTF